MTAFTASLNGFPVPVTTLVWYWNTLRTCNYLNDCISFTSLTYFNPVPYNFPHEDCIIKMYLTLFAYIYSIFAFTTCI